MLLSTGKTNAATPINSAVGIGETRALQAHLATNLNNTSFVRGNGNVVYDTIGTGDWKFYVASSTSIAAITSSSASSEWTGGSLLSYLEDYYVLYYNFDTTLVSGSNVYNTGSKSYDATLVNATVVTTSPSPSVFGTDRGYLVCSAANYLQINGTYITGLTGTSIATWINVNGTGGDIFNSSDGAQSSIQLYVSGGTSIVLSITNNADSFSTTLYTNAAVNNGSWHHVVLVMTPVSALSTPITNSSGNSGLAGGVARWQLFFDGTSVYNQISPTVNCKYPDYIVRGTNKIGPITALIDDFRVYDIALTTANVSVLNSRFSSWYKFNSAIGNNTIDSINGNTAVLSGGASIQTATPSPIDGGYVSLSSASQQYITIPQFAVGPTSVGHSFFFKTELSNAHKILTSFSISQLNAYITIGIVGNSVYLNMNLTNGIAYSAGGGTFQSGFTTFSNLTSNTGGDIAVSVDDKIMVTHKGFNASVAQSILVSNFSGSTWGVPTSIGSMTKLWNLAMSSDGKRIVATQKGGYVFVSTWNGTSYSAFVQTSDATSRTYTGLGMTADGSRIVCCTNETGPSGNVYMALWNEATNNYNAFTTIVTGISTSIGYDTMCISVDGFKIAYSSGTTCYWASWNGTAYVQQTSFTCVTALNMKFTIDANILLMTTNSATSAIYSVFFNGTTFSTLTAYGGTTVLLNKNLLGFHVNVSSYFYFSVNGVIGGPYRNRTYWGTSYRTYRCNTITDNNWHNIYFNFYSPYYFEYWFDGTDLTGTDVLTSLDPNFGGFYANKTITTNYIGRSLNSPLTFFDGSIDDLRFYNRRLSAGEMTFLMTGKMNIPQITAGTSGPTWMPTPATLVDSTETSYTVKSNEIALAPGVNSTYAVWTAPKSTNIRIDVSFADYNSRSAGVGFQMFKINNDNTFGSVIFPRTVTSTALTNANPTNYLSVPSRTISVATGDKIYYRVDANGNTTAASSVLATAIYTDPNQDLKQFKYLQANLGNNIASTSFVGGNANVVNDTLGTGNWKFYVAGNTSIASITGSSASSEWTSGSLLSYITPTVPPTDYSIFYPFETADINPGNASQVGDLATGSYVYNGTLVGSATIAVNGNSRVAGQGYLSLIKTSAYFSFAPFNVTTSGFSFVFWGRFASTSIVGGGRILDIRDPEISLQREVAGFTLYVTGPGTLLTSGNAFDNTWRHYAVTFTYSGTSGATSTYTLYTNGSLTASVTAQYPALGTRNAHNLGTYLNTNGTTGVDGGIDDFRIYPRPISAIEVNAIYAGASPASVKDVTSGATWMSVPGTAVDASETNYTVKSNEVALTPGTNSTFAVWTATKLTNVKVDVSFADYHTRSSGVGFQMFKIKSDNTFDSVLFPRTVTSTALTNANSSNSSNYLTVPSITTTVNVGDKLYYRIDGNGNAIAASSVLATSIYTDDVSVANNPVETKLLQAQLGNNLASATLVAGNSNTVLDTVRTGDWKFYVAGNTSTAAITSSSASSEWTVGNLLSYVSQSTPPIDMSFYYTMNTNTVSGSTVLDSVSGNYSATLGGTPIATISTTDPSPAPGQGYLSMVQTSAQHLQLPSITFSVATGLTFACWFRSNNTLNFGRIMDFGSPFPDISNNFFIAINDSNVIVNVRLNNSGATYQVSTSGTNYNNNVWRHVVWTISTTGVWNVYIDGVNKVLNYAGVYPKLMTRPSNLIGKSNWASQGDPYFNGAIDDFRIYYREISTVDANAIYIGPIPASLKDTVTNTTWMPTPGVPVDASETNYTVKSNEIALRPGTNSTYAVWTAPKSTNLKIDVSFADYHSRSAGVGFQMFKINNDNTFGSVIFPRTVTSTALTNSTGSYLSVPSRIISVATGDKIYYRIDANGNTTAASSVLATNIYVDPNQDLKQFKYLQAHLGNNLSAVSFVAGNANVVNDTLRTGNWNFYVAGNTSVASVTGSSASSEWTVGNLIPYVVPPTDYSLYYTFDTNKVSGNIITDSVSNQPATLVNATISTSSYIKGDGSLSLNNTTSGFGVNSQYVRLPTFTISNITGFSMSFWAYINSLNKTGYLLDFATAAAGSNNNMIMHCNGGTDNNLTFFSNYSSNPGLVTTSQNSVTFNKWIHICVTISTINLTKIYIDSVSVYSGTPLANAYAGSAKTNAIIGTTFFGNQGLIGGIDDFRIYNRELTPGNVSEIYSGSTGIKDAASGATWMPTPGTPVDSSETNYTVKSNEVALIPGTNSTYAVWTATKSTNLKIDVSFADYHTRSSGVGFQMFKIKSDNTFDSVLFPRTVTSTALTNANSSNSSNYLSVPTITTTVNAGDKLYYRVDANGNTIAASSVLATAIYTDDVSVAINPVETRVLQANLGNNLASVTATLVAGNTNTVLDTVGTGNWKFYVAGNTSTAAITSSSASTEWITGNLLSYTVPSTPQNDFSMNFTFNTDKVSGTTITDSSANYSATLVGGGATIATTSPSPAPGTGYLSILNTYSPSPVTTNHVALPPITPPTGGMTLSFWLNPRENRASYIIQIGNGQFNNNIIFYLGNNNMFGLVIKGSSQGPYVAMSSTDNIDVTNGTWKHVVWTLDPSNEYKFYLNGSLTNTLTGTAYHYPNNVTTTQNYIGKSSYAVPYYNGDFDDFRIYNRVLSANQAYSVFMAGAKSKFSDATTGATWIPIPGTVVDTSETSYTVKSNEIALAPGTNSTYAVWTAPKPTNIRIDVSFADYHTRSAGVGFQMFKINSDNTFGSVIFPRTVTGNVLTNANSSNSSNYLSVPSRSLSVSTGDKIYYRIDANGNTNAASSVLATNIYSYSGKWS